jgi:hypothetical protein
MVLVFVGATADREVCAGADLRPQMPGTRAGRDADRRAITARPRELVREQPVVKVWRRTETGEAPRWQGATTENTGSI